MTIEEMDHREFYGQLARHAGQMADALSTFTFRISAAAKASGDQSAIAKILTDPSYGGLLVSLGNFLKWETELANRVGMSVPAEAGGR